MGILTDVVSVSPSFYYGARSVETKRKPKTTGREISRLISAAVVNKNFCQMLLTNPRRALAAGFQGESFLLDSGQKNLVYSIKADSLADFASQLIS